MTNYVSTAAARHSFTGACRLASHRLSAWARTGQSVTFGRLHRSQSLPCLWPRPCCCWWWWWRRIPLHSVRLLAAVCKTASLPFSPFNAPAPLALICCAAFFISVLFLRFLISGLGTKIETLSQNRTRKIRCCTPQCTSFSRWSITLISSLNCMPSLLQCRKYILPQGLFMRLHNTSIVRTSTSCCRLYTSNWQAYFSDQARENFKTQAGTVGIHKKTPPKNTFFCAADVADTHGNFSWNLCILTNRLSFLNEGHEYLETWTWLLVTRLSC